MQVGIDSVGQLHLLLSPIHRSAAGQPLSDAAYFVRALGEQHALYEISALAIG
jgi:hypothetical protein